MDGSVARMSNADRLGLGHGLPMSVRVVDIGLVEQQAPSTSSQTSPTHPSQWIRSDIIRYIQQGAAFRISNHVPPTTLVPPTLKSKHVPPQYYGHTKSPIAYKSPPSTGPARQGAPHRAPGSSRPPPTSTKPRSHQTKSCAANTRNPLRNLL
jgi:hypothetical protein